VGPPERELPDTAWLHYQLYKNVKEAIATLPSRFRSETFIAGINTTDIHTLNTVLGAAIEEQVVLTLNSMRAFWDHEERYSLYSFVRQAQTFPDVLLKRSSDAPVREGEEPPENIILGIELKGWYLLAKEGEPSLRYETTKSAIAVHDLVVVVPWALSQVISGTPVVFDPYIEVGQYAADYRNYYWQVSRGLRGERGSRVIFLRPGMSPYPVKSDAINDEAEGDTGGNFGRLARSDIMNEYMAKMMDMRLCGVKIQYWLDFIKAFKEKSSEIQVRNEIERLTRRIRAAKTETDENSNSILEILAHLGRLANLPEEDEQMAARPVRRRNRRGTED